MKKRLILAAMAVVMGGVLGGCASRQAEDPMRSDWRTGTDYSPYRSIPAVVQCDDCRYEK